jgi:cobalt-zinc-cadmium efflux system protein
MPPVRGHHHSSHSQTGHAHSHAFARYDRAFLVGLVLNGGFVLTEFVFGLLANSVALLADAGHNLSDVLGLVLAWSASLLSRRQPSSHRTYGWRKSSILAAFLNAFFLLLVTGGIAWEAMQRLANPSPVEGKVMVEVAAIGILINTGTAIMFAPGSKQDLNLRATFLHMAADAIVSLGVVLAGIAILVTDWLWLDPLFSLIISGLIAFSTWQLLKDSFHLAIDGVPGKINLRAVRTYLAERPGVVQVHDLHIWGMSTVEIALTAHLVMPAGHPGDEFLSQTCQELHDRFDIQHATLQIEIGDPSHPCLLEPEHQV